MHGLRTRMQNREWLSEAKDISPLADFSSYRSLLHAHSDGVRLSPPQVDEMPADIVNLLNKNHQKLDKHPEVHTEFLRK